MLLKTYFHLANLGVNPKTDQNFADRLRISNLFTMTCISFSIPYVFIMLLYEQFDMALVFVISAILFSISLFLNKSSYFDFSRFLIILTTNFVILFLCLSMGYKSGFQYYYYTSPLIVFILFRYNEYTRISLALFFYLSTYVLIEYLKQVEFQQFYYVPSNVQTVLSRVNILLSLLFLTVMALHFSRIHHQASIHLNAQNKLLTEQKTQLQKLVDQKNVLLAETHHRVKNNLAVISGLFSLQMDHTDNVTVNEVLLSSKARIKSMSFIHEYLYAEEDVSNIQLNEFIERFVHEYRSFYFSFPSSVKCEFEIADIRLDLQHAVPCTLILNEVLTNAFKHAFSAKNENTILIRAYEVNESTVVEVIDNGVGFNGIDQNQGLGLTLIEALTNQLDGTSYFKCDNGTIFHLEFPS